MVVADGDLDALAAALAASRTGAAVLTGAGVSAASGIPPFRTAGGLWERHDPMDVATLSALQRRPERVWRFLRELDDLLEAAEPNPAHRALAALEARGAVAAVITQNVDGLHQAAGSRRVIELHGSRRTASCLDCGTSETRDSLRARTDGAPVPRCATCGGLVKPDVTLFGEALPAGAMAAAEEAVRACNVLLVVGTSAEVAPAATLPDVARSSGAALWEVNPRPAVPAARSVALPAEEALPALAGRLGG